MEGRSGKEGRGEVEVEGKGGKEGKYKGKEEQIGNDDQQLEGRKHDGSSHEKACDCINSGR